MNQKDQKAEETTRPIHTINGKQIDNDKTSPTYNPGQYGRTHDYDCPGCANTKFTSSPRSETYWAS